MSFGLKKNYRYDNANFIFPHRTPYINWFEHISFFVTYIIRKREKKSIFRKKSVLTLTEALVIVPQNIWGILETSNVLKKTQATEYIKFKEHILHQFPMSVYWKWKCVRY